MLQVDRHLSARAPPERSDWNAGRALDGEVPVVQFRADDQAPAGDALRRADQRRFDQRTAIFEAQAGKDKKLRKTLPYHRWTKRRRNGNSGRYLEWLLYEKTTCHLIEKGLQKGPCE